MREITELVTPLHKVDDSPDQLLRDHVDGQFLTVAFIGHRRALNVVGILRQGLDDEQPLTLDEIVARIPVSEAEQEEGVPKYDTSQVLGAVVSAGYAEIVPDTEPPAYRMTSIGIQKILDSLQRVNI